MQLFFDPDFSSSNTILNSEESKHCVRVLRHNNGDIISIQNGKGSLFKAEIIDNNPKSCAVNIIEETKFEQKNYLLTMAVSPTKNIDRYEWFLEKATEIGIDRIIPLICSHSERKVIKPERLEKILISASKQSLKAFKPELQVISSFKDLIKHSNIYSNKYIAHCYDGEKTLLKNLYTPLSDALILIGPEGDFSEEEVKTAKENGFKEISLGKERLRTETAALFACATINLINQND